MAQHMLEAAMLTKALVDEPAVRSFLKTSGGKGLHLVVPLSPRLPWNKVKGFSQHVVDHIARTIPQRFVAKSGPRNRICEGVRVRFPCATRHATVRKPSSDAGAQ